MISRLGDQSSDDGTTLPPTNGTCRTKTQVFGRHHCGTSSARQFAKPILGLLGTHSMLLLQQESDSVVRQKIFNGNVTRKITGV